MNASNKPISITTPAALEQFCADIAAAEWLAVDTEFLREKTYYPQLCLVQVSDGERVACIDPLVLPSLEPLLALLYDTRITKVMHAARQDLEIFYHLRDSVPEPVFDTQIAAPLLGMPDQVGYAGLVETRLGVKLHKAHSRADWTRRPLPAAQLEYAADDVRHLAALYPALRDELHQRGRLAWLDEDLRVLCSPATYANPPAQAWERVKGISKLRGRHLSALQHLAAWRERTARDENKPRGWLLKDESLIDIARLLPGDMKELRHIRGLNDRLLARHGDDLVALIVEAQRTPPHPLPEHHRPEPLNSQQDAVVDMLLAVVRLIGIRENIHPSALTSRKELEALVRGETNLSLLKGWRKKLAGEELTAVLRGEHSLRIKDGALLLGAA